MSNRRILVIDNEEYIQEVTKICLETVAGWEVITASSGIEGIKKATTEKPDVILLDVMMPDMDGLTTFKKLQEQGETRNIPVILLTAKIQNSDRQRYAAMGMQAVIPKPFNPMELAQDVATALGWS
ncbi:response regulator [Calothrix sp. NIES-3974]|uniref:response regulator n=1 Tax=Calothrix sp. NIES-3974 TaxID=2005462 RepID=UPI000B5EE410|nr:response regulator [Calothrix sp. NIES-3974]BAZ04566.1 two-component response regulator [Calothrix sp. NIES-3974]